MKFLGVALLALLFFFAPVLCTKKVTTNQISWTDSSGKLCGMVWSMQGTWYARPTGVKVRIFTTQMDAEGYIEGTYCSVAKP